jgi:hypothetical protein
MGNRNFFAPRSVDIDSEINETWTLLGYNGNGELAFSRTIELAEK